MLTVEVIKFICLVVSLVISAGILGYFFGCTVTSKRMFGVSTWCLNPKSVYRVICKIDSFDDTEVIYLVLKEKYFNGAERLRSITLEISLSALFHPLEKDPYSFDLLPTLFSVETEFVNKEPKLQLTRISPKQYREHGSRQ